MKLQITTLIIIEDQEVQDVIHSLNEDPDKAKQEILDQVNNIYSHKNLCFISFKDIHTYFDSVHLECQELRFSSNGTIIKDISL